MGGQRLSAGIIAQRAAESFSVIFIWRQLGSAPFAVANDAQFLDGIDPEDGDMLESPTRHSMEEFLRIK